MICRWSCTLIDGTTARSAVCGRVDRAVNSAWSVGDGSLSDSHSSCLRRCCCCCCPVAKWPVRMANKRARPLHRALSSWPPAHWHNERREWTSLFPRSSRSKTSTRNVWLRSRDAGADYRSPRVTSPRTSRASEPAPLLHALPFPRQMVTVNRTTLFDFSLESSVCKSAVDWCEGRGKGSSHRKQVRAL